MRAPRIFLAAFAAWGGLAAAARADDIKLYPTGPDQVSGFLRFVNAGDGALTVSASGADKVVLEAGSDADRAGQFLAVPADQDLSAKAALGGSEIPVELNIKPNEFVTVVVERPAAGGLALVVLRDLPEDFNVVKADLAFYNADPACAQADLLTSPQHAAIFSKIAGGRIARRSVNPVSASVEVACDGQPVGSPVALGSLRAGGRYSLIIVPGDGGRRVMWVEDKRPKF